MINEINSSILYLCASEDFFGFSFKFSYSFSRFLFLEECGPVSAREETVIESDLTLLDMVNSELSFGVE